MFSGTSKYCTGMDQAKISWQGHCNPNRGLLILTCTVTCDTPDSIEQAFSHEHFMILPQLGAVHVEVLTL